MAKHTTDMDKLYEMIQNRPSGDIAPDFCASGTIRGLEGSEMFFTVPDDADKVCFQLIPFINDAMDTRHSFFGINSSKTLTQLQNCQEWNAVAAAMGVGFEIVQVATSSASNTITYVVRYTSNARPDGPNTGMTGVFCVFGAKYVGNKPTANKTRGVHTTNLDEIYEMIGSGPVTTDDINLTSTGSLFKGVPQPIPTDIMHFAVPEDATDIYFIITETKELTLDTSYAPKYIHMTMQDFLALTSAGFSITPDIKCYKVINGNKWGSVLGMLRLTSSNALGYYIEVKANGHFLTLK